MSMKTLGEPVSKKPAPRPKSGPGAAANAAANIERLREAAFVFNEQVSADPREALGEDERNGVVFDEDYTKGE